MLSDQLKHFGLFVLLVVYSFLINTFSLAATLPTGFAESRIVSGIDPTSIKIAPDGRLFIAIKSGKILIYKNGVLLSTPFINIAVDNNNERGLQSIIFDPNFNTNKYIYAYYAVPGASNNRVSRFTANGDVSVVNSEVVLLELDKLTSSIHNGGSLFFKDGKLLITSGDGGNPDNSQSFNSLLGKVLRINTDGSIPADNPFVSSTTGKYKAIYALGFRNPFKASIQPGTGKVYVNDVGNTLREEINELFPGKNYGWPIVEGKKTTQTPPANYQDPLLDYNHNVGCSITGGTFYNPPASTFPAKYMGRYFYQDYCNGWMKVYDPATANIFTFATGINYAVDVTIDLEGNLYYVARQGLGDSIKVGNTSSSNGEIWKVRYTGSGIPTISAQPTDISLSIGGSGTFIASGSGDAPLSYQWQKNGVNIPGATSYYYTVSNVSKAEDGTVFRVVVTNSLGSVTSSEAVLSVKSNHIPTAIITCTLPNNAAKYNAGQLLSFSGTATDFEDGTLPSSNFTWKVDFYHLTHTHPAYPSRKGSKTGSYLIPTSGENSSSVWYRVFLTVIDSDGETFTTFKDVYPNKVDVVLTTNPAGLKLKLDGTTVSTPHTFNAVVGIKRNIEVVTPQVLNGATYYFKEWSDGGTDSHEIFTPTVNTTYTATYQTNFSNIYEAENALLSGPTIGKANAGYSGTGYADYTNLSSNYIEWSVNVPAAGNYILEYRYSQGTSARPLQVKVNENIAFSNLIFPGTASWTNWESIKIVSGLSQGNNKIRLTATGSGGPNVDHLKVAPADYSTIFQAENALLSGVTIGKANTGYTGTGYTDYTNASNDFVEWSANVEATGNYTLQFRYALLGPGRVLQVKINNNVVSSNYSFATTNSWTNWQTVNLSASLIAGVNKIRVTAIGNSGPNIDYLHISNISTLPSARLAQPEIVDDSIVSIFPVPAKDFIYIKLGADTERIEMKSIFGENVKAVINRKDLSETEIDVRNLKPGLYLLIIKSGLKTTTRKVYVEK